MSDIVNQGCHEFKGRKVQHTLTLLFSGLILSRGGPQATPNGLSAMRLSDWRPTTDRHATPTAAPSASVRHPLDIKHVMADSARAHHVDKKLQGTIRLTRDISDFQTFIYSFSRFWLTLPLHPCLYSQLFQHRL